MKKKKTTNQQSLLYVKEGMEETLFKQILSLACRTAFYFSDKNYDENLEDVYFVFSFYILS